MTAEWVQLIMKCGSGGGGGNSSYGSGHGSGCGHCHPVPSGIKSLYSALFQNSLLFFM
jgi:hypothetical protein